MNPAVKIRKVRDKDLMRIFGFYFDLFSESYRGVGRMGLRRLVDLQRGRVEKAVESGTGFVAEIGGNPVGCALFDYEAGRIYLEQLYVMKHFRRLGLGGKLIREVARKAATRAYPVTLFLPTQKEKYQNARVFYDPMGFEIIPDTQGRKMILPREQVRDLC